MSGFLILGHGESADLTKSDCRVKDAFAAFARKGMVRTYSGIHGSSTLHLFASEVHDPAHEMSRDEAGRLCTYVGTMLYKGRTGRQATAAILEDVAAGRSDAIESALGNYCLLVGDTRGLRILTDPAGLHHVYHNDDLTLVANSFVAAACASRCRDFRKQEILEYVLLAAAFGKRSLLTGLQLLPARGEIQIGRAGGVLSLRDDPWVSAAASPYDAPIEDQIAEAIARCDCYFGQIASAFGGRVSAALSGGYDSRLVVGLLLRHGITPDLFVYGSKDDKDVRVAKEICHAEGMSLRHVDRDEMPVLDPLAYWQNQDSVFHGLDGLTQYGFACNPDEITHRRERIRGGQVAVNGGGGEIWRDFWKLPDRRMTPRQFVGAVYGGRLAGLYGSGSNTTDFLDALSTKVAEIAGVNASAKMSSAVIQSMYARFRLRFWQGKNNSVDNHIGYALTPFAESMFAIPAMRIPVSAKRDGWFERQMIQRIAPGLAAYKSAYAYDFLRGPGLAKRLAVKSKYWTPLWVRRAHRRFAGDRRRLPYHSPEYIRHRFGNGRLEVERYLRLDRIRDPLAFSRALTVERMLRGQWDSG